MSDDPNFQQAIALLTALEDHIDQVTRLIEKAQRQRTSRSSPGPQERVMRQDLAEAHDHVLRIHRRFPGIREAAGRNRGAADTG